MDKKLLEALEALKQEVKGKTETEVKEAIAAFETEYKDLIDQSVKTAVETEVKAIEDKLNDEIKTLQDHNDKLDVKMQKMEQGGLNTDQGVKDAIKAAISANFDEIKSVRKSHGVEVKAVGDMTLGVNLTGDQNREYQSTVAMVPGQAVNFEQLIRTIPINTGTFTYPRETGSEGEIAIQVEGNAKAQIDYDLTMVDANTDFLAGFARYSKKMANNLPYLEGFLPQALRRDYYKAENALFYSQLVALATPSVLLLGNIVERIVNEATTLMALDYVPTMIVISPQDYGSILLTAGPEGGASASYSLPGVVTISNGIVSINGIQVVVASWVPADKYIIGDWSYAQKIQTQGLGLGFFEQDADNVTKNMITARIEAQIVLACQRPDAFITGDFTTIA